MLNTFKKILLRNSNTQWTNAIRVPDYYKENPKIQYQFLLWIMSSYLYENLKNEWDWLLLNYNGTQWPCRFERVNGEIILTIAWMSNHPLSLRTWKNRDIWFFNVSDELCWELHEIMMAYWWIDGVIRNLSIKHKKYILNEAFSGECA